MSAEYAPYPFHAHRLLSDDDENTARGMERLIHALERSFLAAYFHQEIDEYFEKLESLWFGHYTDPDEIRVGEKKVVRRLKVHLINQNLTLFQRLKEAFYVHHRWALFRAGTKDHNVRVPPKFRFLRWKPILERRFQEQLLDGVLVCSAITSPPMPPVSPRSFEELFEDYLQATGLADS